MQTTKDEATPTTCGAYDHKGTVRCAKRVAYRITDRRTGEVMFRCEGHTRKFRTYTTFWTVEETKVTR